MRNFDLGRKINLCKSKYSYNLIFSMAFYIKIDTSNGLCVIFLEAG